MTGERWAFPQKIVRAICTSFACPSQWDTWDAYGNYYYIRYRSGVGEVVPGPGRDVESSDGSGAAWDGYQPIVTFDTGDSLDGVMSLKTFCDRVGIELAVTEQQLLEDTAEYWVRRS